MPEANHSLPSRRDSREQEQLITQTATVAIEMAKPYIRFQSELLSAWANSSQVFARIYERQAETFTQLAQEGVQQSGQQFGGQQNR
jgi:ABC-type uncharacterized transport system involved in gliding motility auxiliary subunit